MSNSHVHNRLVDRRGGANTSIFRKGSQTYALVFDDASRYPALYQIGYWAADKRFNFNWKDASQWSGEIRAMGREEDV